MNTQEIVTALQPLAQKLGQGAENLYRIYVRQAIVDGILSIIFSLIFISLCLLVTRFFYKRADDYDKGMTLAIGGIISSIIIIIALFAMANGISELVNPQYHAVHNIITDVTGKNN